MSRLRTLLGDGLLGSQPYALRRPVTSDFATVLDLLAEGRVGEAVAAYPGPLLPDSEAPAIVDYRSMLEQQLRAEVLASGDATRAAPLGQRRMGSERRRGLAGPREAVAWRLAAARGRGRPGPRPRRETTMWRQSREFADPGPRHGGRMQRSGNPSVPSV